MGKSSVSSTKTKVNIEKARDILAKYELRDVEFLIDKEGNLRAVGEEGSQESWPQAVPVTEMPKEEDYENEQEYWDELWEVLWDRGADGFVALLQELVSCIESPMTIVAASSGDHNSSSANVWRIEPGSAEVQKLSAYEGPGDDRYWREEA